MLAVQHKHKLKMMMVKKGSTGGWWTSISIQIVRGVAVPAAALIPRDGSSDKQRCSLVQGHKSFNFNWLRTYVVSHNG